jgi:hypothetical protein
MRPVRANSWFFNPFFSTNCWAMVSPVAKSTAVVILWVKSGLLANFIWYLYVYQQLFYRYADIALKALIWGITYQRSILAILVLAGFAEKKGCCRSKPSTFFFEVVCRQSNLVVSCFGPPNPSYAPHASGRH